MRKNAVFLALTFVGLAGFAAFAVWTFIQGSRVAGGWRSLEPIWPIVAGGLFVVGALTGFLMWLAFYSANHGYDDRTDVDGQ
jgi:hypothetical protein